MSVNWSCSFPDGSSPPDPSLDYCCFNDRACASYVCGKLGSSLAITTEAGSPDIFGCYVVAEKAEALWSSPPKNGTCGASAGTKGCVHSSVVVTTSKSLSSTASATISIGQSSAAASASAFPSSSTSPSAESDSAGFQRMEFLGQTTVMGLVGLVWLIRRLL
ncbi:hypothetical protein L486_07524 [Kwoniella mangroviensis CBS 10435]|uniref:Uncharacterized protein n=1 Tax=Kwoniella mangroviensis CBS 10435 TaxID=1331196 RepID=A0A1B9IGR0_9TREE|nr:uncharacterized protein I203_03345 [Kwoniella mangroviensis CBS 8507]OCF54869.1 hypothetical protein L486_07524 [Kwoniella mangroviensis CBS 10435]OCF67648.1 hypothetical protein I203_03345 [Kwoniella mangroviensis CBS 8507]OCF72894.1 hypothetical protein I204_06123 [Kwoniella mangroviensis CBS 8886]